MVTSTRVDQDATFDYFDEVGDRHSVSVRMTWETSLPWHVTFVFDDQVTWLFEHFLLVDGQRRSATKDCVNVRPGNTSALLLLTLDGQYNGVDVTREFCMPADEIRVFLRLCNQLIPEGAAAEAEDILHRFGRCTCKAAQRHHHSPAQHLDCKRFPGCGGCDSCTSAAIITAEYQAWQRQAGAQ